MKVELLSRTELEEILSEQEEFQFYDDKLTYFSPHTENRELLKNLGDDVTEENLINKLYQLEEQTKIPASYLHTDLVGPTIYIQTTTHQPISEHPNRQLGRLVTRLKHNNLPPKTEDLEIHEEVRKAIINTKAFKHELYHNMDSGRKQIAQFKDGLLITDATKENTHNLSGFLQDYYTEVNSQAFRQQAKDTYRTIQLAKETAIRQFLE